MKRVLFALMLMPFIANAQKLELGVGGGVSFNSVPGGLFYAIQSEERHIPVNSSFYGKILLGSRKVWQTGINLGFTRWAVGHTVTANAITGEKADYKMIYGNPAVNLSFEANRNIDFAKSRLYFGMNLGALFMWGHGDAGELRVFKPYPGAWLSIPEKVYLKEDGFGPVIGLHVGYTRYFGRLGINAEASPRYAFVFMPDNWYPNLTMLYCPVTVGLRAKL